MADESRPPSIPARDRTEKDGTTAWVRAESAAREGGASLSGALRLANWLKYHDTRIDHLRLQKLLFYCFGAAVAHGYEQEIGTIRFHAWKHGPVNLEVYREHRHFGRSPLDRPSQSCVPTYSAGLEQVLRDVVHVYGQLSPWQLREESHHELPWRETRATAEIEPAKIRAHFLEKFAVGQVRMPKNLLRAWSFRVDGVPLQRWHDLHALALELQT